MHETRGHKSLSRIYGYGPPYHIYYIVLLVIERLNIILPKEGRKHLNEEDGGGSKAWHDENMVALKLSCAVYRNDPQAKRGTACIPDRGSKVIRRRN